MSGNISIQKIGITKLKTDAIVNAANDALWAGGGVCGAIFKDAGYDQLTAACNKIGGCKTDNAVITPGFNLPAKYIIHAVGPMWSGGNHNEPQLLYSAYKQSLILAKGNGLHSIGFPLISAGIYGYPKDQAWRKAIQACLDFLESNPNYVMEIIFAVLDDDILQMGEKTLQELEADKGTGVPFNAKSGKAVTSDLRRVYQFAKIHKVLYEHHEEIPEAYFRDHSFIATGMRKLGFNMDCGESMIAAFPGINMFHDVHALKSVMDRSSIQLLGDAIYSQWRYWNHWSTSPMGDQDYEWFAVAFDGLARLVKNEMEKDNKSKGF